MSRDDLIDILRKHEVAHLGACVDVINGLESVGVPEADTAVGSTTSTGEEAVLVGGPADGFDSGCVVREFYEG